MSVTKVKTDNIVSLDASQLSGTLPAMSGAALTGLAGVTKNASDPAINTNPSGGVGTLWTNTTSGEMYACKDATAGANVWLNVGEITPNKFGAIGDRGLFIQCGQSQTVTHMQYITIPTLGNSTNFGNTSVIRNGPPGSASNGFRGVTGGGYQYSSATYRNDIDYVTLSTPGNAIDFGNLTNVRSAGAAAANVDRAIFACGHGTTGHGDFRNEMDYITVTTTGNATDFGDASTGKTYLDGCASETRAFYLGGYNTGYARTTVIDYVTIATTGNAGDFGDLLSGSSAEVGACSNGTRAIGAGGSTVTDRIQYFTMGSNGNAADFGNLSTTTATSGCVANDTRAVMAVAGGLTGRNTEYITIATLGDAQSFGTIGNYGEKSISGN
tara:strand:- start:858 stop:2006 length:1149 start_codon:yes stop_codon:yes gene_type:complete